MNRHEAAASLVSEVLATRRKTIRLTEPLSAEDAVVQSMPDASPAKWHLGHTTWLFDRVLQTIGVPQTSKHYEYIFNSYYNALGKFHPRPRRGMLTRPSLDEVLAYRRAIDARLADLEGSPRLAEIAPALELGMHHEQQHQELILTDIKTLFAANPLLPAYATHPAVGEVNRGGRSVGPQPLAFRAFDGGLFEIGHGNQSFCYDNEAPRHKVYIAPFSIATRLVTAGEYLAFIHDGGYERPLLWLSDGWAWVNANAKRGPLYWAMPERGSREPPRVFTLRGERDLDEDSPVCHVTYYEADAYARWAGARLPTEAEWEVAATAANTEASGNFADEEHFHPIPAQRSSPSSSGALPELAQMMGDAWEWTQSAYLPYPGFRTVEGAFAEYNGKFMVGQMVLRGGSCATPRGHVRITYRNYFPPNAEWQFSGIRLAKDP
ncbi:MAG: ergothioneine biosynthesis protein EgtB [Polyangiaceae bacterium]|nr:ergothioneine biosynthesis protein EgtB [Polyangiaceae bacterium]